MTTNQCPFCNHENLADEKFCSTCGSVVNLVPCPNCDAVNEKTATTCYRCHTEFKPSAADALGAPKQKIQDAVLAGADPPVAKAARSKGQSLVVGGIVMIAVAVAFYFAYWQRTELPASGNTGIEATSSSAPAVAPVAKAGIGGISKKPDASPGSPASAPAGGNSGAPEGKPAVAAEPAPVVESPAPVAAAPQPIEAPPPAAAAPAPVVAAPAPEQFPSPKPGPRPSRHSAAGGLDGGRSKPPAQCTEAIAALGLCTLQSNQTRQ